MGNDIMFLLQTTYSYPLSLKRLYDIQMHPQLIQNISKHVQLSPKEKGLFDTFWTEKTLHKGDYLLRNGEVCKNDNYIISGALKAFYINSDKGKEEILYFSIDDWWATDILSFQRQRPSLYNIQALEETRLLQINYQSFQNMLVAIPKLERYFRVILEVYLGSLQRRIIVGNTYDAAYRYSTFLKDYPKIVQKVPQYLIASYLGVSPEFISRIRKK
ncbi:Crp/Fnr family transcriptional regulator [Muricauda sp. ANG21]|uniref:Crp/Fnr family transcriptional regulator n=1 Tax=Allomuricauda sp. ANG21 TaxID=3042468 RepID=UPI003455AB18